MIRISKFDTNSKDQFMKSDRTLLGTTKKSPNLKEGDIIALFDFEKKEYFGIAIIGAYGDKTTFRENPIYSVQGIYDGEYVKYSKYESPIKKFYNFTMKCDTLIKSLKINCIEINNIVKNSNTTGFAKIFYGAKDSTNIEHTRVLDSFRFIIENTIENIELSEKEMKKKIDELEKKLKECNVI